MSPGANVHPEKKYVCAHSLVEGFLLCLAALARNTLPVLLPQAVGVANATRALVRKLRSLPCLPLHLIQYSGLIHPITEHQGDERENPAALPQCLGEYQWVSSGPEEHQNSDKRQKAQNGNIADKRVGVSVIIRILRLDDMGCNSTPQNQANCGSQ